MNNSSDLSRLRSEYARREQYLAGSDRYSLYNTSYLFTIQQRQRVILRLLRRTGIEPLKDARILEVGCGSAGVLLEYLTMGARQRNLFGIDLLHTRLTEANDKLPHATFANSDAQSLPFASEFFDLVLQYTAFTSVLDNRIKENMAKEMRRVMKAEGAIIWYDFWLNPTNSETRGIRPSEIRRLFPDCNCHFQKITLAPPLARKLVRLSWVSALILEKLTIFNTHYLAIITK
jgi:ubiquinone/menaquinone biosynthesis C-methylase UbiE